MKQATIQGTCFSLNNFLNDLPVELHQFAEKGENVPGVLSMTNKNILFVFQVQDMNRD